MRCGIPADFFDRGSGFFNRLHRKKSSAARQMRAEPGVLHHDRAPACQISRRPIAEPTGVGLNEDVLANTELSLRTGNVIAKCVERKSDTVRIANSPSGTLQLRPWHIAA